MMTDFNLAIVDVILAIMDPSLSLVYHVHGLLYTSDVMLLHRV